MESLIVMATNVKKKKKPAQQVHQLQERITLDTEVSLPARSPAHRDIGTHNSDGSNQRKFPPREKNRRRAASGWVSLSFCCIHELAHNFVAGNDEIFLLFCGMVEPLPCSVLSGLPPAAAGGWPGLVLPRGLCLVPQLQLRADTLTPQ